MRLIDADALMEKLEAWSEEADRRNANINYAFAMATIAQVKTEPTIEPERKAEKMVKKLAAVLDGCPLTQPCDCLWEPEGWCKEHCKAGQGEPDAECWLKYAEVKADE